MMNHKYFGHIAISIVLTLILLLSGCNSTDSSEENGNNSQTATFDSGELAPDDTYSYTFDEEGLTDYYCKIHTPNMQGEITVTSSAEAVDRDTVIIENNQFQPRELSIAPNTEVVWINRDNVNHTATSGNPSDNNDDNGGGY
jgi:plastocyanin